MPKNKGKGGKDKDKGKAKANNKQGMLPNWQALGADINPNVSRMKLDDIEGPVLQVLKLRGLVQYKQTEGIYWEVAFFNAKGEKTQNWCTYETKSKLGKTSTCGEDTLWVQTSAKGDFESQLVAGGYATICANLCPCARCCASLVGLAKLKKAGIFVRTDTTYETKYGRDKAFMKAGANLSLYFTAGGYAYD